MMRINFLASIPDEGWAVPYCSAALQACEEVGDCELYRTDGMSEEDVLKLVLNARPCDVWYSSNILDIWLKPITLKSAFERSRIIVHNHGGMETHDIVSLNLGVDDTQILPRIATHSNVSVLFNTLTNLKAFNSFYGIKTQNPTVVGFPVRRPEREASKVRRILVPGRFCATKNTHLAAEILLPFADEVLFSTMHSKKCDYWRMLEALGYEVVTAFGESFDSLLYESSIIFTASMSDSFNSSVAEGASFGGSIVAPNWGPFREYVHEAGLYTAFSVHHARGILDKFLLAGSNAPKTDVSFYHRENFIERVKSVLKDSK
jgi:hypothetical protein